MSHAALMAGYSNPLIVVDGADFDGTNDYMARGAGLTGAADSKTGILSCWVRLDAGATAQSLFHGATSVGGNENHLFVRRQTTNIFEISADDSGGVERLNLRTSASYPASATWLHILASWDLAVAAAHFYINDVSDLASSTLLDNTLDYTIADWSAGGTPGGATKLNGCLAELYFAPGQYLNFSLEYNRRKFINSTGKPVHLGITGATPTGTAPLVYMHLDNGEAVANFATNRGTGGSFSITGTLDTASSSPSD